MSQVPIAGLPLNNTPPGTVLFEISNALLSESTTLAAILSGVDVLSTKGDILSFSTVNARLGVGTNNQVLTADSAELTGLKWADNVSTLTPWTEDVDADGWDLRDLSNLEFRTTTLAPAGTIQAIHAESDGLYYNVPAGDAHTFKINNATEMSISNTQISLQDNNLLIGSGTMIWQTSEHTIGSTGAGFIFNVPTADIYNFGINAIPEYTFSATTADFLGNSLTNTSFIQIDNTSSPILELYESASPANGSALGMIDFYSEDANLTKKLYARIAGQMEQRSIVNEGGGLQIQLMDTGTLTTYMSFRDGDVDDIDILKALNMNSQAITNVGTLNTHTVPAGTGTLALTSQLFASPLTTKGDIFGFDTANNRVPVGLDNQVLIADSTQALGLKYGLINDVNLAAGTFNNITGLPGVVTFETLNVAAILTLTPNRSTPATGNIGDLIWQDNDSIPSTQEFARIRVSSLDVTSGSEDATMTFRVVTAGSISNYILFNSSSSGEIAFLKPLDMFTQGISNANFINFDSTTAEPAGTEVYMVRSGTQCIINAPSGGAIRLENNQTNPVIFDGSSVNLNGHLVTLGIFSTGNSVLTAFAYNAGVKQSFLPSAANAGLNFGSKVDPDPTVPVNGDVYYNTTNNKFRAYENSVWVDLIAGGIPTSIAEGNSNITVVDAGTGTITTTIDGTAIHNVNLIRTFIDNRFSFAEGTATLISSNNLIFPNDGNYILSGGTNGLLEKITSTNWQSGSQVMVRFNAFATNDVLHNGTPVGANHALYLIGRADYVDVPTDAVFGFMYDANSSLWREIWNTLPNGFIPFSHDLTINEGIDIALGTATGTKIGTATSQKLGFYNATPVIQPTVLTTPLTTVTFTAPGTPDYAIQDLTQTTPFGFVSSDEAQTVISVIANLQSRVNELETKLQSLGLLA